jgi:putative transposase
MGNVYRTLVLKYDLLKLRPDAAEKISALLKVQEEFRRWANQWLKDRDAPKPEKNPLKYFAEKFIYAAKALNWLLDIRRKGVEVGKVRPPLIFNTQLRLNNEKDIGRSVFVDLPERQVKIRKWSGQRGNTITLPLSEDAVRWILERVREGGKLTLAAVGSGEAERAML